MFKSASVACVVSFLLLVGCGEPSTIGAGSPDDPVVSTPEPDDPDRIGKGPQRVVPRTGLVDVGPISWQRAKPTGDGRSIEVFWYSGVEECNGLDRVELAETSDEIEITLFEGRVPEAEVCIEIAVKKVTTVALEEPIGDRAVTDGAERH
jgi:hypothetical protein